MADFGLSMRLTRDMSQTYASVGQAGTSRYMSPELLDRYSDIDKPEAYKQVRKSTKTSKGFDIIRI